MPAGLVIFGEDWGAHPSSTQHLASRLRSERDIVWVNSLGLRRPRLDRADVARAARKIGGALSGRATARGAARPVAGAPMTIVEPRAVSWPGSRLASLVNRVSLGAQLRGALARRGMDRPILWASLPSAVSVVGALGERAVVYYCGDDFGALAGVDHAAVVAMERELVARAHLVLAASPALASRFPADKTVLLPHGVDVDLFSKPAPRAADLPVGRPIAGFYGSIAEWIDVEALANAARALPDVDFVLIGDAQVDIRPLEGLANLRLLGRRAHHELPRYARHWDVSLLPFRDTPQIRACNPLKLREYLAAGQPIVSTECPALDGYRRHIEVARDGADLVRAIAHALNAPPAAEARRASVAGESWDRRAATVAQLLDAL